MVCILIHDLIQVNGISGRLIYIVPRVPVLPVSSTVLAPATTASVPFSMFEQFVEDDLYVYQPQKQRTQIVSTLCV